MNKIKKFVSETIYVSKLTRVNKKKLRIVISVLFSNITVALDILIIVLFSNFFVTSSYENNLIEYFLEREFLLPYLVFFRFLLVVFDKLNIKRLQINVSENLKDYLIRDIYKRSNYSVADANFYINQLTDHVSYFYGAFALTLSSVLQLLIYILFLITTDFDNFSVFFLVGLIIYIPTTYFLKKGRYYTDKSFTYGKQLSQATQRIIENMFLIKILNTKDNEINEFNTKNKNFSNSQFKNYTFGTLNSLTPNFLVTSAIAILIVYFGLAKNLSLEFIGVTLRLVQTLAVVNNGLNMVVNSKVHLEKLSLIDEESKNYISDSKFLIDEDDLNYSIILKNVNFRFFGNEELFFNDLNLKIVKGSHTIVTGPNGSGKSTLLGIISGALKPINGTIKVNSNKISYVGVKPLIVDGTIRENLLYGNDKNVSDNKILENVELFKLFNEQKKVDLDQIINNQSLSSGQFQKIAYIRAILSDTEILILDESMSNLDEESKKLTLDILSKLKITIINSTHNFSDINYDYRLKIKVDDYKRKIIFE